MKKKIIILALVFIGLVALFFVFRKKIASGDTTGDYGGNPKTPSGQLKTPEYFDPVTGVQIKQMTPEVAAFYGLPQSASDRPGTS